MPTKNVNQNVYMVDEKGEMYEINKIENLDIEPVFDSEQYFDTILPRGIGDTFELSFEVPKATVRSILRTIIPNNWLKMHGYPMRRR